MWKAKEQQHLPTLWNSHSTHSLLPPSSYHVWGPLSPIKDPEIIRERQIYDIANMQNLKKKKKRRNEFISKAETQKHRKQTTNGYQKKRRVGRRVNYEVGINRYRWLYM